MKIWNIISEELKNKRFFQIQKAAHATNSGIILINITSNNKENHNVKFWRRIFFDARIYLIQFICKNPCFQYCTGFFFSPVGSNQRL